MANPTRFPLLRESDIGIKDGPVDGAALRDAFRRLFAQLNPGLDAANKATSKGLTLADNLLCDIVSGTFAHGVANNFALANLVKANSALPLGCDTQLLDGFPAVQMVAGASRPTVAITMFFRNVGTTNAKCSVLLLGEGMQSSSIPAW